VRLWRCAHLESYLRDLDARAGAAISIPTATFLFVLIAPFTINFGSLNLHAVAIFALVGVIYPVLVTVLTFRSNDQLGPTVTATVSGTAPIFALAAAVWLLGETVPPAAVIACIGVAIGIALLSWKRGAIAGKAFGWALLWPLAGAIVRGFAQAAAKLGLLLWPSAFALSLISYLVSTVTVIGTNRWGRDARRRPSARTRAWFMLTGVFNGAGMLLMYYALSLAPVSVVAPVVASYPLITALFSAAVLREERIGARMIAGSVVTVLAIAYLVASRASG
jgi:uncharacterized membrane protein